MNNEIEQQVCQTLRRLRIQVPAEFEQKLLADAASEMNRCADGGNKHWWRRAAAVVLLVSALAVVIRYFNSPGITLAQVSDAIASKRWVHLKYDNGREEWTNLSDGKRFYKDYDGRIVYTEPNGLRLWLQPKGQYIARDQWWGGEAPPPRPANQTPWDAFVKSYEDASLPDAPEQQKKLIERHADELGNRPMERFDCYYIDALNRRLLVYQIWADPATRLPVQVREVLQLADREEQKRDAIVGQYEFPTTGPSTIYDLGVSQNLPIVDSDAAPTPGAAQILDGARVAAARFPTRWRIIQWDGGDADIIYRDGEKESFKRWFTNHVDGSPDFPRDPTADAIMEWTKTRTPVEENISDGQRDFRRQNAISWIGNSPKRPKVRLTPAAHFPPDGNYPPGAQWPFLNVKQRVDPPADAPAGIVVLSWVTADRRRYYWIDPARDYICIRQIEQKEVNGQWKNSRVDALENLKQLPGGQWVATRKRFEDYGVGNNLHDRPYVTTIEFDFRVLDASEIPPGAFDGEPLLKDADVETF